MLHEANIGEAFSFVNKNLAQWDSIQLPVVYVGENWPIRYVSVNSSGHYIAVAGKRGLCHYSIASGKWKMFGNEFMEQSFIVRGGGILWWDHVLLFSCQNLENYDHELRFFSRDFNLDNNLMMHVEKMPRAVGNVLPKQNQTGLLFF